MSELSVEITTLVESAWEDEIWSDSSEASSWKDVIQLEEILSGLGIKPGAKICDLGSGHGKVMMWLKHLGWETYGIERDPRRSATVHKGYEKFKLGDAQIITGDYMEDDVWEHQFPDGASPQDMDFFYCFAYTGRHPARVLSLGLAGPNRAPIGSFSYVGMFREDQFFRELGFVGGAVPGACTGVAPVVKKIRDVEDRAEAYSRYDRRERRRLSSINRNNPSTPYNYADRADPFTWIREPPTRT